MPLGVDVPDAQLSVTAAQVSAHTVAASRHIAGVTYRCIVMPHPRKSFTRSTLLMTSRPRLSKTNTFHIGSPSELRIGVDCGIKPFAADGSCRRSLSSGVTWLRLRMRSIDATPRQ